MPSLFGKNHKQRQSIARLSPDELSQMLENERVMDDWRRAYSLMIQGQRTLWWTIRQKYNLPENIDFDRKTGEVFPKDAQAHVDRVHQVIPPQ